jgi:hypothetical protein
MKANACSLLGVFENKLRLEVPLFQRQYVWTLEQQWAPLWEDIQRKFTEHLDGRTDGPVHFLGAMVLDQKQTPTTHVVRRQVIDGQQRLTTFQIFLAAFRDFCAECNCPALAAEVANYTANKGMMAEPEVDRFKVWPTQADRQQFSDVMTCGSRAAIEAKHPLVRKKWARHPEPRPRMIDAYLYFSKELHDYFIGSDGDSLVAEGTPVGDRLEAAFQALKNSLQVVVIDLEQGDDAQVIFETLNARGEPLLPADLLRNYIFLRAGRRGESQDELYAKYWLPFDDPFWRSEVGQGRLLRPRSDLFMQHFLASRQAIEIPIKHLYAEYKHWIESKQPFATTRDELLTLASQREAFKRILAPDRGDVVHELATFLSVFEMSTAHPLLLLLLESNLSEGEWGKVTQILESYILRRALRGGTTKNYNRVFLTLVRNLRRDGVTAERISSLLAELTGPSTEWPSDDSFQEAWRTVPAYETLSNARVVFILKRISDASVGLRSETVSIDGPLTIEHLLPQDWLAHWPLPCGAPGLTNEEIERTPTSDTRAVETRRRRDLVHTLGNLTIVTQALNSSVSNAAWEKKRPDLLRHSLLSLNQDLHGIAIWNEEAIIERSARLFTTALTLWPCPPKRTKG